MSDTQRDLLRLYVKRVGARRACWRTLRQLSVASLVFTIGIYVGYWPPIAIWLLGILVSAVVVLETPSTTAIVMDRIGGHLGLVECAVDHMKSDEKIVVAQRKRAWDQVGDKNVGDYAPAPSLLWWLPVVSVVVVAIQSQVTRTQMIEGASNEAQVSVIVPQPNKVKQAEKEPSLKRRAKTKPRIGSDVIRKPVAKPVDSPQSPKRKEAQAGQKVGAVSGGETGIKFVAIESQKAATTLKIEGSSQTLRSSGKIDGRIVEPARPFPPQYHQVIETWFRRQKE